MVLKITRAYDLTTGGVLSAIALVIHRVSVELFNTQSALYKTATDGTANLSGPENAAFLSEFLIVWLPLLMFGFAWTYALIREYRRQVVTARTQVGP